MNDKLRRTTVAGLMIILAGLIASPAAPAGAAPVAPLPGPAGPRPKGVQVWNCTVDETIRCCDCGPAGEPPRPISVIAVRNSVFSGRLVVSSDAAIKGLKVSVGALKLAGGDGELPASAVKVRYAVPAVQGESWVPTNRFDGLVDVIPAEIPVITAAPPRDTRIAAELTRPGVTNGAVAPIWITVTVPKDAKAGKYAGTVTVSANGLGQPTAVPLNVTVYDWAMPDPRDFRTHILDYVSVESEAKHYGVPLWSDQNFELLGKSLALMAQINARQVLVDLAINWYGSWFDGMESNSESVVRWVKQADGSFTYDFTVLDKYLETVAKSIGKPLPLRFNCWGAPAPELDRTYPQNIAASKVTVLDPATGKLSSTSQPDRGTEESFKFWKPVLDEVRKRVEARGWFDVTCLGHNAYAGSPAPEVVSVAKRIWPDGAWGVTTHGNYPGLIKGTDRGVTMPIRYSESRWNVPRPGTARGGRVLLDLPSSPRRRPADSIWCEARTTDLDLTALDQLRWAMEERNMAGCDGEQLGADYFPVTRPNGRGYGSLGNSRGGLGPHQNGTLAILAAGPDGPIASERFEAYREGVEFAEAVLFLEKALHDKKISGDLEQRVNKCLDERGAAALEAFKLPTPTGRSERDEQLLALAGEVAKVIGAK